MLCICNGTVVTPRGLSRRDLWIDGGKIVAPPAPPAAFDRIDAAGKLIFPGFIDSHTHFEMPVSGTWTADSFASGTAAAIAGGTTVILDFATQDRGHSLREALEIWHSRADGHCSCDYGFHMAVSDWNAAARAELEQMPDAGVTSFKAYMAYDNLKLPDVQISELLSAAREIGYVGVHCELGDTVKENQARLLAQGKTGPAWHPVSRPNAVESEAIRRFLALARTAQAPAWVVHLSTREGLAAIRAARQAGQDVLVETCPQYLTLTDEVYRAPDFAGAKYVCSPPIRSAADRDCLCAAVRSGETDILSTDHCSFRFRGQKELGRGDFTKIPNGLPGVEHRPAVVWSTLLSEDPAGMCAMLSENPAKAFGLWPRKGNLEPGADADVVIWDSGWRGTLTAAGQLMACDYSPWEGLPLTGRAERVFLRGTLCAENGRVLAPKRGIYLHRGLSLRK